MKLLGANNMKIKTSEQLALIQEEDSTLRLKNVKAGIPFTYKKYFSSKEKIVFVRLKPINYLCNSTIISDNHDRGVYLVANLNTGVVFFCDGNTEIELVDAYIVNKGILK